MPDKQRHIMVPVACEYCEKEYWVRKTKFDAGKAKYCSKACFHETLRQEAKSLYGYEKGKKYWDATRGMWVVRWYDDTGKAHTTSYQKWYYTVYVGEVPEGKLITCADGNFENIDPSNFILVDRFYLSNRYCKEGHPHTEETKQKLSAVHKGKPWTEFQRSLWVERQKTFVYKEKVKKEFKPRKILRGPEHPNWRDGKSKQIYPYEFRAISHKILERDGHRCRICTIQVEQPDYRVHHIDADKFNNDFRNLILLCISCHTDIHSGRKTDDPVILAFRSQLYK